MANISIRNLDDSIKEALRLRAAAEHCSMEEFLRRYLAAAAEKGGNPAALAAADNKAALTEGPEQSIGEQNGGAGSGDEVKAGAAGGAAPDFMDKMREAAEPEIARAAGEQQSIAGQAVVTGRSLTALRGKNIVLIIGGSIAAYKALELIRLIRRARAVVRVIMTAAAQQFITPLAAGALAGGPVYRHLFAREGEQYMAPGFEGGGCEQENMPGLGGDMCEEEGLSGFGQKPVAGLGSRDWPEQMPAGHKQETEGVWAGQTEGARASVQTMSGGASVDRLACCGAPFMAGGGPRQAKEIGHIQLARQADIVLLCAATASRLAKMAAGQADDLAGAVLLATRAPVLLAPAMNPAMWAHKATQRNVALLRRDGCHIIGPERGEMAESGEAGLGRMSEPATIMTALAALAVNVPGSSSGEARQGNLPGLSGSGCERENMPALAGGGQAQEMPLRSRANLDSLACGNAPHMGMANGEREQKDFPGPEGRDSSQSLSGGRTIAPGLGGFERRQTRIAEGEAGLDRLACGRGRQRGGPGKSYLGEGVSPMPVSGAYAPGIISGASGAAPMGDEDYAVALSHLAVPGAASLVGRHIIVTSGPTHEALDPVRYLANRSSGKQGHALAAALAACGARVTLVCGPVLLPDPPGVEAVHITSARQMRAAVLAALPADAAIFVAAVADWRPQYVFSDKIKKPKIRVIVAGGGKNKAEAAGVPAIAAPAGSGVEIGAGQVKLTLVENPDILAEIGHNAQRPRLVVGFAAETRDLLKNAAAKLAKKGADWIIANNIATAADGSSIMGGDRNHIHILSRLGVEEWPEMSKIQVAARLAEKIAAFFAAPEQK